MFEIFGALIDHYLANYRTNPSRNYKEKDVVYCLVSTIISKYATERSGTTKTSQLVGFIVLLLDEMGISGVTLDQRLRLLPRVRQARPI